MNRFRRTAQRGLALCLLLLSVPLTAYSEAPTLYDFTVKDISGSEVPLAKFRGSVLLIVNTASKCGYTPQYKGLEELHKEFSGKGFTVLGFPSNDFGGQEPGTEDDIKHFCENTFGVTFPLFSKSVVSGPGKSEVFKYLTASSTDTSDVKWNFEKFLVDRTGKVVARYRSSTSPTDPDLVAAIEDLF